MYQFISSLTPTQITVLIGTAAALLQVAFVKGIILKLRDWERHHIEIINVITSVLLPAIFTVGSVLATNSSFKGVFPHYAEAYLAAQTFYYTAIRFTQLVYGWYQSSVALKSTAVPAPLEVTIIAPVVKPEIIL